MLLGGLIIGFYEKPKTIMPISDFWDNVTVYKSLLSQKSQENKK